MQKKKNLHKEVSWPLLDFSLNSLWDFAPFLHLLIDIGSPTRLVICSIQQYDFGFPGSKLQVCNLNSDCCFICVR